MDKPQLLNNEYEGFTRARRIVNMIRSDSGYDWTEYQKILRIAAYLRSSIWRIEDEITMEKYSNSQINNTNA